jgi:hypothetical protein
MEDRKMCETRNSSLFGKITVLVVICCCCLAAQAKYGGGTGEPNDPYLIFDANQMNAIGADSNDWDKHFLLCADIDLSDYTGTSFNIIGSSEPWSGTPFTGVFDGNDHTISNFTYGSNDTAVDTAVAGLFGGVTGTSAVIKNVGLINANVCGRFVGSLIGMFEDGTVENCYANGVGSLIGMFEDGTVENCYANGGSVRGFSLHPDYSALVGGLVGLCFSVEITNCYATGITAGYTLRSSCIANVGGLVAYAIDCTITNSYVTGSVFVAAMQTDSLAYAGGLAGTTDGCTITNSYAAGKVEAITDVVADVNTGGLVGYSDVTSNLTSSFWDTQTSGQINGIGSGDPNGVYGKTTAEMMQQATFDPPWDFLDTWGCAQTSYPPADVNKDCRIDFYDFAITALSWLQDKNW